ncbi:hypothetical protein BHC46_04650 [Snodgrassella alvi]|uniref:Uncharacterized protein n=2 Tax=Snodgrassella TaxID=1193515 RepID=A0A2N9XJK3_9NEIS|nr:polymorphic toxin type 47 domain-containing protein [Snodgrassella alvi]PIT48508.1 hypothetical protein BHC46_04650 [Snodgrassella alvi]
MQATSAFINSKKDQLKEELKQENLSPEQRAQYEKELAQWNSGGLILNAIGAGLAAPTNSIGGIVAATASPVLSYQIGQYFKVLAHKNQITGGKDELTAGQETAHILAHTILGAAVAAAGGNDALAGGLAAAGAEATAPILSQWLYGKNPADLTADEKATVSAIAGLTGAATGVAVGGSMADVAQGNQAGHVAVDNNTVLGDKIREYIENARQYWHTEQEAKDYLDVIRNVAVNAAMGSADSVIGTVDYGIDSLNAVVYCLGFTPTYCSQSQETLTPKNQEIVNSVKTSLDVRTYKKLAELIAKAAQGDLLATEAAGELLVSTLVNKKPKPTSINGAASVGKKAEKGGISGDGGKASSSSAKNNVNQHNDPAFKNGYVWKPGIDADLRGTGKTYQDALNQAFNKLGIDKSEFSVTKWGSDKNGKSFPTEYRVIQGKNKGAEVNIDIGHDNYGPGVPHIGFQTPGKNNITGHILVDEVPINRTK